MKLCRYMIEDPSDSGCDFPFERSNDLPYVKSVFKKFIEPYQLIN